MRQAIGVIQVIHAMVETETIYSVIKFAVVVRVYPEPEKVVIVLLYILIVKVYHYQAACYVIVTRKIGHKAYDWDGLAVSFIGINYVVTVFRCGVVMAVAIPDMVACHVLRFHVHVKLHVAAVQFFYQLYIIVHGTVARIYLIKIGSEIVVVIDRFIQRRKQNCRYT